VGEGESTIGRKKSKRKVPSGRQTSRNFSGVSTAYAVAKLFFIYYIIDYDSLQYNYELFF
jgi:hypothetical protein